MLLSVTLTAGCANPQTQTQNGASQDARGSTTAETAALVRKGVDRARGVSGAVVVTDPAKLVGEELPLYYLTADDERTIKLYFADEGHEIPYIDADTAALLLEDVYHDVNRDAGFDLTVATKGHTTTLTRENGYEMTIDADKDSIYFTDLDAFFMPSDSPTVIDILEHYGLINCLERVEEASYSRYGSDVAFELAPYGIDVIEKGGVCYLPLSTFTDICCALTCYVFFLYNGQCVCANEYGLQEMEPSLLEKYYAVAPSDEPRSDALTHFSYQELCLALDYCYGLSEQHNIDGFDAFFIECGLRDRLLDPDALESTRALGDLVYVYLADGHCAFNGKSCRVGKDARIQATFGKDVIDRDLSYARYEAARTEFYPDGVLGYEEIGDIAYITFDTFDALPEGVDYYKDPPTAEAKDTVGICLYAFRQITREGSPVKNVVLDLSCNGGGDTTTACFVLSLFLGEARACVEDTLTGAYMNETFRCDANLDGTFDKADSLEGYRLFCMTSPCSFSCGNLVPSVLKSSGKVKTIGAASGGGSCIVMPIVTADGTRLQISSHRRMSHMVNGSVYDIDRGVVPDYPIASLEHFYDRAALTDYIDNLY